MSGGMIRELCPGSYPVRSEMAYFFEGDFLEPHDPRWDEAEYERQKIELEKHERARKARMRWYYARIVAAIAGVVVAGAFSHYLAVRVAVEHAVRSLQ